VLTDSFLERAMDTHMSALSLAYTPRRSPRLAASKTPAAEPFLRPSPVAEKDKENEKPNKVKWPTPATPDYNKSARQGKRRQGQRRRLLEEGKASTAKSKISPGLLILSDSDSDCHLQSPVRLQMRLTARLAIPSFRPKMPLKSLLPPI